MNWNSQPFDTEGHVIFKVPLRKPRQYFGLVFSRDWAQWFLGVFTLKS